MKLHNSFFPGLLISLILFSCTQSQEIGVGVSEHKTSLKLNFPELQTPLEITAEEGMMFFETSAGRQWIAGDPLLVDHKQDTFLAQWQIDERIVRIQFVKNPQSYAFRFSALPGNDILKWGFSVSATPEEYFTGLFERTVDGNQRESWKEGIETAMNLRGEEVEMIVKPTLSLYTPFYLSSNNYGLFVEGTWPGYYNFCKDDSTVVKIEFEGTDMAGIIYTNTQPAEIVKAHSLYVGPTIVPPKWAFLPWRWRDNHVNLKEYYEGTPVSAPYNSQVVEDILMMKGLDIPCGVYWVDRPWAKGAHGYADFDWDPERFPRAEEMIDWIHKNDMKFILWIAPWITGEMMETAKAKGYTQPMKPAPWGVDSTNAAMLDFTNPDAVAWWQEKGIEKMLKQGVDGFKLDRSEELVPETRDITVADGRTFREVRNDYPVKYVKAVNESAQKIHGDDFVLIPRAGYTGSAQYSGFWGGDIGSPPEGLRAAIIAMQRSAIIGFPVWGSDIGGYWQGDLDREVTARWLAFGCFNPIMEFGPTEDRAPWSMDSEPNYDTTLIAVWRLYAKLHTQLADYSYKLVQQAHETGMPPVRPLFLQYPDQSESWDDWETFLYGPDILVSAIWEKGKENHLLYLPAGETWVDAWDTDKTYEGGQMIEVETPMHKIPIFIRQGTGTDLGDLNELYSESLKIAAKIPDLKELEKQFFQVD